jgi:hypothetical protein
MAGDRIRRALTDARSPLRIAGFQFAEPAPQPGRVELRDWKLAQTALCATGTAQQPRPTQARRFSEGGVYYLDQRVVAGHIAI